MFYPDIRCMYQSLMNKYDAAVREESMVDEDTLEQLCDNSSIICYDIKSAGFSMGGFQSIFHRKNYFKIIWNTNYGRLCKFAL